VGRLLRVGTGVILIAMGAATVTGAMTTVSFWLLDAFRGFRQSDSQIMLKPALALVLTPAAQAAETGNPARGEQCFRACGACHSLTPDQEATK
jgi:mono/diheme cytochrome c family protein